MRLKKHHPIDKSYKFMYRRLGIKMHRYFFKEGEKLKFLSNEIPTTGQKRDITVKIDDNTLWDIEFQSLPLDEAKLRTMYNYYEDLRFSPDTTDTIVRSGVIDITKSNRGIDNVEIDYNVNFHPDIVRTKSMDGVKVLSTLIYKVLKQEELSDTEAIDLLILPDMDIDYPIEYLMKLICFLIGKSKISDKNFKHEIILCEITVLNRFFENKDLLEVIDMLIEESQDPEISRVVEKYGLGFDVYYFDGKHDGKLETARNFLAEGIDEEIIARCTGFTLDQIKKLKEEL